jgi:hypothetical protein
LTDSAVPLIESVAPRPFAEGFEAREPRARRVLGPFVDAERDLARREFEGFAPLLLADTARDFAPPELERFAALFCAPDRFV